MSINTIKRNKLIERLRNIPTDRLDEIIEYISKIEQTTISKNDGKMVTTETIVNRLISQETILSYAGSWAEIDSELFEDMTTGLIENRQRNQRRYEKSTD